MAILAECPVCHARQSRKNKKCIGWLNQKSKLKCNKNLDDAKKAKKVRYYITYRMPDGKQRWESVGAFEGLDPYSVADAQNALAKRKVQKKERRLFDMLPDSNLTFADLIDWFLGLDKVKSKAYFKTLNSNLKHFKDTFGDDLTSSLRPVDLENFQVKLQKAKYSDSYIDSILEAAKNATLKAFDNELIGGEVLRPFRKTKKLTKVGDNARTRTLTHGEYKRIRDNLPVHTRPIFITGYLTGMRRGEITNLTWDRVDLANRLIRLTAAMTKERKPKTVPISKTLRSVLMQLPGRGKDGYIFKYLNNPIKDLRTSLRTACKKANVLYGRFEEDGFIFHDLRRTWITNARKASIPRNVSMKITGHSDRGNMNSRYDQIDDSDLLNAIDQIDVYLQSVSENVNHESIQQNI